MILLPGATGVAGFDWIAVGESTRHEALQSDDGGTSYVKCNDDAAYMILEYANPSVAEDDITSIESVRFLSSGKSVHRTDPSIVAIQFEAPTAGFSQICSYDAHRTNYETINGTVRTTYDGTHAWAYANLEALEMRCTKSLTVEVYLSYLALEVTYTAAVTDNATFFGANF
tara:strand:- start:855 stop:1367 length:513 start_codon:yes stop_codon:yes gene_type:complete